MDPKLKRAWLTKLRSGRYKQDRYALYSAGCYCCLGVLGRCMRLNTYDLNMMEGDSRNKETEGGSFLDTETAVRAGIAPEQQLELGKMNDAGLTFAEIADYIEENL